MPAVATSTKLGRKVNDPGPANLWNITGGKLVGFKSALIVRPIDVYKRQGQVSVKTKYNLNAIH